MSDTEDVETFDECSDQEHEIFIEDEFALWCEQEREVDSDFEATYEEFSQVASDEWEW